VADIHFEHDQVRRDVPQILEALQNPSITAGEKMEVDEGEEGFRIWAAPKAQLGGGEAQKAQSRGPTQDIADLFSHSYTPPPPPPPVRRWFWIQSSRVLDPEAERFPASASDIRRFGGRARTIEKVRPVLRDSRSFAEVTSSGMDRRALFNRGFREDGSSRDGRVGRNYGGNRDLHGNRGWDQQGFREGRGAINSRGNVRDVVGAGQFQKVLVVAREGVSKNMGVMFGK